MAIKGNIKNNHLWDQYMKYPSMVFVYCSLWWWFCTALLRVFLCNASSNLYIYIVPFNWYFMYWSHKWLFLMFPCIAICVLFLATLYLCNLYVYTPPTYSCFCNPSKNRKPQGLKYCINERYILHKQVRTLFMARCSRYNIMC
jgi:hypothetical protein